MTPTSQVAPDVPAVWTAVCPLETLPTERGVAALLGDTQIALFRLWNDEILAVGNHDPFSETNVIARGIVGTRGNLPTVASPMYKQVFELRTGICCDAPGTSLPTYQVTVIDGMVHVLQMSSTAQISDV